ncbi:MAG: transposase [Actinobacteria bacterium]|nr:transposase [Actinomycetota bacterium]
MRRHIVTKGSFYERLADHGDEIVSDDDFAGLYSQGTGRPSIPPSVMVRAMLCATHDRTSDAETSRRTRVDADWKAAMGVDDEFTGIAPRTFSLMRSRMVVHDADATLFEATLKKAVEKGILKGKLTAIIDSSPVHGAGRCATPTNSSGASCARRPRRPATAWAPR